MSKYKKRIQRNSGTWFKFNVNMNIPDLEGVQFRKVLLYNEKLIVPKEMLQHQVNTYITGMD